jgi:glycosyltransferase involved in cell wall biosynthesis
MEDRPVISFLARTSPLESSTRVRILKVMDRLMVTGEEILIEGRLLDSEGNPMLPEKFNGLLQFGDKLIILDKRTNIVIVQKWATPFIINGVHKLKDVGAKIVYDTVDRDREDIPMLCIADYVITDCPAIEKWCREVGKKDMKIIIIPDSIDYLDEPIPRKSIEKTDNLNIVFFANPSNLQCMELCRDALIRLSKEKTFTFTYISGKPKPEYFGGLNAKYVKWSQYTFSAYLREFDLAILPQKSEKGDAKLVTSITHNLPTVSSNMESYRLIASQTDTTEFLCQTTDEWYNAIKKMFDPQTRTKFLDKTVDWVWTNYNIDKIIFEYRKLFSDINSKKV